MNPIFSSFRTAYTAAGTLEDSVYVHHDFLHQGTGSRLLKELIDAARRKGLRSILANISADQKPSIRLHEKFGFQKVAHLRDVGQKFNQRFDAVYLQLLLAADDAPEPAPINNTASELATAPSAFAALRRDK